MEYLSKNFQRKEFACKCGCGFASVDIELLAILEKLRTDMNNIYPGTMIKILSGNRCESHNAKVGGRPHSFHKKGMAADVQLVQKGIAGMRRKIPPVEVFKYLDKKYRFRYGVILYETFVHLDIRDAAFRDKDASSFKRIENQAEIAIF